MKNINIQTVEAVSEAIGINALLDSVLAKLDDKTVQQVLSSILKENGLELTDRASF